MRRSSWRRGSRKLMKGSLNVTSGWDTEESAGEGCEF